MQLNYAYPVTRIRARETQLIDQSRVNRMLDADQPEDILKMLQETEYGEFLATVDSVHDYEQVLAQEMTRVNNLLLELAPDPCFKELIVLRHDLHNLKVMLKSRNTEIEPGPLMSELGSIPPQTLQDIFAEEAWRDLPEQLREGTEEVLEMLDEEGENPQLVDIMMDRLQYQEAHRVTGRMRVDFLTGLYRRRIDLLNIEIFVRARAMGKDRSFLEQALVGGGKLDLDIFTDNFNEALSSLSDRLAMTDYAQVVQEGLAYWDQEGTLVRYEKLADDFLMEYIKQAKFVSFGPEPLIGYLWAKENEIKTLRILLVGKINNLPVSVIKERLRDLYV